MSHTIVRKLYETRLLAWAAAQAPAVRVAVENVPFVPTNGAAYVRAFLLPAETESATLEGEHRGYVGVFQVSVIAPINVGSGTANAMADSLAAYFLNNARLTSGGFTVQQISPASVAPPLQTAESFTVPVSWRYRADTTT